MERDAPWVGPGGGGRAAARLGDEKSLQAVPTNTGEQGGLKNNVRIRFNIQVSNYSM